MTEKQCYMCFYFNINGRNTANVLSFIENWCDIGKAHNKYLLTDKKCPYFKKWTTVKRSDLE